MEKNIFKRMNNIKVDNKTDSAHQFIQDQTCLLAVDLRT